MWILGSSIVHWAEKCQHLEELTKRYATSDGQIKWLGKPGAGLNDFHQLFSEAQSKFQPPRAVIIHLGGNDICHLSVVDIFNKIHGVQCSIRQVYPDAQILYSEIIYRLSYRYANNWGAADRARRRINTKVHALMPGRVVSHRDFQQTPDGLISSDGVHLTDCGNWVFLDSLFNILSARQII